MTEQTTQRWAVELTAVVVVEAPDADTAAKVAKEIVRSDALEVADVMEMP